MAIDTWQDEAVILSNSELRTIAFLIFAVLER
jgi:hypothetical protein